MRPSGIDRSGGATAAKWARPSGVGNCPAVAEPRPAPLDLVARLARASRCPRRAARPVRSPRGSPAGVGKRDEVRRAPGRRARPARARISHSVRASPDLGPADLWAEGDAPLGGGLGAAAALLVAGRRAGRSSTPPRPGSTSIWVVTTMSWCTRSGTRREALGHQRGVGQHVEEVAAARVEHVELARRRRPRPSPPRVRPGAAGTGEAPLRARARPPTPARPARRPGRRWRRRPSRRRPGRRSGRGWASGRRPAGRRCRGPARG